MVSMPLLILVAGLCSCHLIFLQRLLSARLNLNKVFAEVDRVLTLLSKGIARIDELRFIKGA